MGFFGTKQPLDPRLEPLLIGNDRQTVKRVTREQDAILGALGDGEEILLVGADHYGGPADSGAVVLTDRRLLCVKNSSVRRIDASTISGAQMGEWPPGKYFVKIDGPGTVVTFPDYEQANTFGVGIYHHLLGRPAPEGA